MISVICRYDGLNALLLGSVWMNACEGNDGRMMKKLKAATESKQ